jgi:hypothetical protein
MRLVLCPFSRFTVGMPSQPPGDRAVILACSVRSLRSWCLDTHCPCGRSVVMPLGLMVASGLGELTIADVLVQLRCRQCGQRPAKATLLEHGAAGARGIPGASGWVVPLVGGDKK